MHAHIHTEINKSRKKEKKLTTDTSHPQNKNDTEDYTSVVCTYVQVHCYS